MVISKLCSIKIGSSYSDPKKMSIGDIVNALNAGKEVYEVNPFNHMAMTKLTVDNFIGTNFDGLVRSIPKRKGGTKDMQPVTVNVISPSLQHNSGPDIKLS